MKDRRNPAPSSPDEGGEVRAGKPDGYAGFPQDLLDHIPAITYIAALDERSTTSYVSPQIGILGYSPEEFLSDPDTWSRLLHPEDRERVLATLAESHRTGAPYVHEYRMIARDGRVVWFHDEALIVRDESGRPRALHGVMLDVTERKRAEEALRDSQATVQGLLDAVTDVLMMIEPDGTILALNRGVASRFGRTPGEMLGRNIFDFVPPEVTAYRRERLKPLFRDGQLVRFEDQSRGAWFDNVAYPVCDASGRVSRLVLYSVVITERKRAEEALRESESLHRSIIENSGTAILMTEEDGIISFMNHEAELLSGWSKAEAEGKMSWTAMIAPEDVPRFRRYQEQRLSGDPAAPRTYEGRSVERQGRLHDILLNIALVPGTRRRIASVQDITEMKKAERDLLASQRTVRALLDSVTDVFLLIDREGIVLDLNRGTAARMGRTPADLVGRKIFEFLPPDVAETRRAWAEQAIRGGRPVRFEDENRGRTFDNIIYPMRDDDGPPKLAVYSLDITERKRVEEALRASESRYRGIVEDQTELVCRWTTDTTLTFVNDAYARYFGRTKEELTGRRYLDLLPEAERAAVLDFIATKDLSLTREHPSAQYEHRVIDKDGRERIQQWVDRALFDGDGRIVEFQSVGRDVTEARGLERDRALLAAAIDASPDGITILERAGTTLYANAAYSRMLGVPREVLVGLNVPAMHRARGNDFFEKAWSVIERGRSWSGRMQRKVDGVETDFEVTFSPVAIAGPEPTHMIGVARDISERTRMEEQLRVTQRMEALGTLAGGIAHDFNNILAAIVGQAEVLRDSDGPAGPSRAALDQILQAGLRGRDLVKRILTFSRGGPIERRRLDLNPLLEETIQLLRASLPASIRVAFSRNGEGLRIEADAIQVQQVIMNLAVNGADAMPSGGVLEIGLSRRAVHDPPAGAAPGDYVVITVRDQGTGMEPAVVKKIFEPFFTTKPPGRGTGMGLPVVYGILRAHGGFVTVESRPGLGSVFEAHFPSSLDGVPAVATEAPKDGVPPRRILLVDDDPAVLEVLGELLRTLGHFVVASDRSVAALELFRASPAAFDLAILDQTMPDLAGNDLARALLEIRKDLPVLLITGYSDAVSEESVGRDGIRGYAMKPLGRDELAAAIRRTLGSPPPPPAD